MSSAQQGRGAGPVGTGLVPAGPRVEPSAGQSTEPLVVSARLRGLAVAVCALLLVHFVATVLWTAPGYLTGRPDAEPGSDAPATGAHRVLDAYMTPVFAQSWAIFAPSPLHVEYALHVRGVYAHRSDGVLAPGPWSDATAVEARALTGHLLPAATERPSRRLAAETRAAYLALPDAARGVVLRSPLTGGGPAPASADPWPALRAALLGSGAAPAVVDNYLATDRAVAAYATQVLRAGGGDGVAGTAAGTAAVDTAGTRESGQAPVYVQVSIVRSGVVPYGGGAPPEPTALTLGARPPLVVGGQDDAGFRRTWDALRGGPPAAGGGAP